VNIVNVLRAIKRWLRKKSFSLRYLFAREVCSIPYEEAEKLLSAFHPMPSSSAITDHCLEKPDYDLLIIVPAYNAEKWLQQCVDSILSQETEYSFLLRLIDDGSTDHTGEIADCYSSDSRVEVIHQENRGYSGARNRGLEHINARYLMFVDSDDYLLPGAIQSLLAEAFSENADIVEGNGYRFNETGKIGKIKNHNEDLFGGPVMKVIRASLFQHVQFPPGYMYEDKIIGSLIEQTANQYLTIPNDVYAYRIHGASITQTHDDNPQRLDSYWMMWRMQLDQLKLGIIPNYDNYIRAMRQIVMTYRRTIMLPEEIKQAIFVGSRHFLEVYYSQYFNTNDRCKKLASAVTCGNYGKYCLLCENITI